MDEAINFMKIEQPQSQQPIPENAKLVFKGKIFDVYQWEQELYDGSTRIFEKLKRPDTVVVFPVMDDGRILLTEQEQPGKDYFIGATGGRVDEGEEPLDGAKRELLEESGYEASEYVLWRAEHITSKIDWVIYTFIAKGLKKVSEQSLDGGEKITLKPVTFDELLRIASDERFSEKEVIPELLEAQIDSEKRKRLEELFKPL